MARERIGRLLAANLKALRQQHGLSLSELARRSRIAKGTLSQLESGAGNPTIETVFSLSDVLDVPVSTLLTERVDVDTMLVRSDGLEVLQGSAVDLRMLRRMDVSDAVFELYDQRVRPDEVQQSDGHLGVEHIVVTQGVLEAGPPDAPLLLNAGDYACFAAHTPHHYRAIDGLVLSVLLLEYPAASPSPVAPSCATPPLEANGS